MKNSNYNSNTPFPMFLDQKSWYFSQLFASVYIFHGKICNLYVIFLLAVNQEYETDAEKEYVIIGNSVLMKCKIPSFVADFVSVESWRDNKNNEYFSGMSNNYGKI